MATDDSCYEQMRLLLLADAEIYQRFMNDVLQLLKLEQFKLNRAEPRVPIIYGIDFVNKLAIDWIGCYKMFRMRPHVFEYLHDVLVQSYGLKSTDNMSSREALGMTLWMLGGPQSVVTVQIIFGRSPATVIAKFGEIIACLVKLANHNVCPKDTTYSTTPRVVAEHIYGKCFENAIGALDGTHVKVCVSGDQVTKYVNRKNETSQNVLAIVDFDRRFTFMVAGVPGSVHDAKVLQGAQEKYGPKFPHPPAGMKL